MTSLEALSTVMQSGAIDAALMAAGDAGHAVADAGPEPGEMFVGLRWAVAFGLVSLSVGILLCLVRLWRGPSLADRVLASDTLALHVVGLVVLLSIYLGDLTFFDAVLGVAIIGFAGTVGFAQYIGAQARRDNPEQSSMPTAEASS